MDQDCFLSRSCASRLQLQASKAKGGIDSIECIGQVPDDEMVVTSTNRGEPCIMMDHSLAGQAYRNIVGRILGEKVPFMTFPKEGFFSRLKRVFNL